MAEDARCVVERGVLTASAPAWEVARRRTEVIRELASRGIVGHEAADQAAAALDLSRRRVYSLISQWRASAGAVSDLLPRKSHGGRGQGRVSREIEAVISDVLRRRYLTKQRRSVAAVHREISRVCRQRGLGVPSRGTVVRRIAALDPVTRVLAREGRDAARTLHPAGEVVPAVTRILERVQIDHTVIDLVVVDERHRLPLGRPYLTVGIDEASRAIVGMVVSLDAPSATSVGLCLAHMVSDKRPWMDRLEVEAAWPMGGKPEELYVDNGAEFHSEALQRGCDEHSIELGYRPVGSPHYGGIVERVIGTMMRQVHELPGTTFSNVAQRGDYDSDKNAALTLRDLQRWLVLAIATYHGEVHESLSRTPAAVWGVQADPVAAAPINPDAFLIDFLPVIRRTLTREGFIVDHVRYYGEALKPLIARRQGLGRFVLRRDPRDISRIWVLDPESRAYLTVGYRMQSRPPISVWEQRAAVAQLRELGRGDVDESALFAMVDHMREITDTATRTTRTARRAQARRPAPAHRPPVDRARTPPPPPPPPVTSDTGHGAERSPARVEPFAEIEQW